MVYFEAYFVVLQQIVWIALACVTQARAISKQTFL